LPHTHADKKEKKTKDKPNQKEWKPSKKELKKTLAVNRNQ
jgi:hypothetical protein